MLELSHFGLISSSTACKSYRDYIVYCNTSANTVSNEKSTEAFSKLSIILHIPHVDFVHSWVRRTEQVNYKQSTEVPIDI